MGVARGLLVVDPDPVHARRIASALDGVPAAITLAARLDPAASEAAVVVACYDALDDDDRIALQSFARAGSPRVLLVTDAWARADYARAFALRAFCHLVPGHDQLGERDLRVAVDKLLGRDVFGIERYFDRVDTSSYVLGRAAERKALTAEIEAYLGGRGVAARVSDMFCTVLDEFVTNAIYNAPVAAGARRFAHVARDADVALDPGEVVKVKVAYDRRRLGLSTEDPFGSITAELVLDYFAKCFRRDADQVDQKQGGAGLGLYYAFDALTHFAINLAPGARTEMIGLVDLDHPGPRAKSFNIFVAS